MARGPDVLVFDTGGSAVQASRQVGDATAEPLGLERLAPEQLRAYVQGIRKEVLRQTQLAKQAMSAARQRDDELRAAEREQAVLRMKGQIEEIRRTVMARQKEPPAMPVESRASPASPTVLGSRPLNAPAAAATTMPATAPVMGPAGEPTAAAVGRDVGVPSHAGAQGTRPDNVFLALARAFGTGGPASRRRAAPRG